jgi:hypothetical protein
MIRKTKKGYKVVSHQTGRSFGEYSSRKDAEERLRQIKVFKHMKKKRGK